MDRILNNLVITATCWFWGNRVVGRDGYAQIRGENGKAVKVHRWMYEHFVGPIPAGLQIDHLCRNRACINPEHLEPVTQRENILRGVGLAAQEAQRTHCPRGHELIPENLIHRRNRRDRECRLCKNLLRRKSNV